MSKQADNITSEPVIKPMQQMLIPVSWFQSPEVIKLSASAIAEGFIPATWIGWTMQLMAMSSASGGSIGNMSVDGLCYFLHSERKESEIYLTELKNCGLLNVIVSEDGNMIDSFFPSIREQYQQFNSRRLAWLKGGQKGGYAKATKHFVGDLGKEKNRKRNEQTSEGKEGVEGKGGSQQDLLPSKPKSNDERKPYPEPDSKCLLSEAEILRGKAIFGELELQTIAIELSDSGRAGEYKNHFRTLQNWRKIKHGKGQRFWINPDPGMGAGYYPIWQVEKWQKEGHGTGR